MADAVTVLTEEEGMEVKRVLILYNDDGDEGLKKCWSDTDGVLLFWKPGSWSMTMKMILLLWLHLIPLTEDTPVWWLLFYWWPWKVLVQWMESDRKSGDRILFDENDDRDGKLHWSEGWW